MHRLKVLFTLSFILGIAAVIGCSSGEPEMHSDWETALEDANVAQNEVYSKALAPTKFTALDTNFLVDAPEGIEFSSLSYDEIVYPYVLQIKVLEQTDLAEAKTQVMANDGFKEVVTDEPNRLVVLVDRYGDAEYWHWTNKTLGDSQFTFTNEGRSWMPRTQSQLDWALKMADSIRLDEEATAPEANE